jgi:hypothetical protein
MLSRLHRKAEALDQACLRAQGHPHDYALRQELLSALEWDTELQPNHARDSIRTLFKQVHDQSVALSKLLQSTPDALTHVIPYMRQSLAALMQVLATRHVQPRAL